MAEAKGKPTPQRPEWFKIKLRTNEEYRHVNHLVSKLSLNVLIGP